MLDTKTSMALNPFKKNKLDRPGIIVSKNMYDYDKDPFFIKKDERAKAFIEKNGIPEAFKKKN